MGKEKVAFLGPVSSYSHQAVIECFSSSQYEYVPMITFQDIFQALQSGEVFRGVVPFENSTNGSVVFTLDLFADRTNLYPDILVYGEAYLNVRHYLLGHKVDNAAPLRDLTDIERSLTPTPQIPHPIKPRTQPLTTLKHIEKIYSHPQAFGQCETFLGAFLKGVERIDVSSTSKAAEMVKIDRTGTSAAIASKVAADVHGLTALAKGIEDREDNTTRFFFLRKSLGDVKDGDNSQSSKDKTSPSKSLVSFTVDHQSPGALADVLECFRKYKLNLTSINSRPSRIIPFQYIFFVEFEGNKLYDPDGSVNEALGSLNKVAKSWRWLGSWEDRLQR